jgi:hypothetical protein
MKNTEKLFWQWLHDNLPGHHQRIENAIDRGTPDANICHDGHDIWLELKCAPFSNVQIRVEQRVWAMRRIMNKGKVLLLSRWQENIAIWNWRFSVEVEAAPERHMRIVALPQRVVTQKLFSFNDLL